MSSTPLPHGSRLNEHDDLAESGGLLSAAMELPAWAVSLGVHLGLLLMLASMTRITFIQEDPPVVSQMEDLENDTFKFDVTVVDQIGSDSEINQISPSQAAATKAGQNPEKEQEKQLEEELLTVSVPITEPLDMPREDDLVSEVEQSGSRTEHTGGVPGSMDRLTFELGSSLKERKTLAIWLFDASNSLNERREDIASRFENVYRQLGQFNLDGERGLKTAVASYGKSLDILTEEPVDDVSQVISAVRNIKPDSSGEEKVFSAVMAVAQKWKSFRKPGTRNNRNIMIFIVTDERGDDFAMLEETIHFLKRYGIKVFCVGNAAVFGREKGYLTWTYSDGSTEDLPVDQGPETVAPERLQLAFWGSDGRDLEFMSASFGPYALTRLCAETGGLYLITDETRIRFDPAAMRLYQPDYRPIREYQNDLQTNRAKAALVAAADATRVSRVPTPQLRFQADTDTVLRQQTTEAQKPAADLDYKLSQMLMVLEEGAKDREKLTTPRWRASFDLAMGRALAMRVRALGYNTVLAEMKASPKSFEKKGSNMWELVPSRNLDAGPQVKKLAKSAVEYLTRVVDEHPGTPWAMLAERELGTPLGWEWKEGNMVIAGQNMGANGKKAIQLAEEAKKKREMRRKLQAKERPKL
ncbi:MAG: VWA domain-containing protein [Planctomycetaceae bacterium]|nr:VWA domain-containing protein [Planctomycetaceae bacterium]